MALTAEIDTLLSAGTAQGYEYADILVELNQRYGQTQQADEFVPISGNFQHTYGTGNFFDIKDFMADTDTDMTLEQVFGRAQSMCMEEDLNMVLQYLVQMVRVIGKSVESNPSFPKFSAKSLITTGTAYFSF